MKVSGTTFLTVDKHCEHKTAKRLIFPVITKLDEYLKSCLTAKKVETDYRFSQDNHNRQDVWFENHLVHFKFNPASSSRAYFRTVKIKTV